MILYHEELRKNLLVKVYLDTDEDIRLSRKGFLISFV
jgi:uridine kinase